MENMHSAIIVLRACGMPISVYDYHQESKREMQAIQDNIQKQFEESKKLEED